MTTVDEKDLLTDFEVTRVISTRALQLSHNSPPIIRTRGETDVVTIATKELLTGKLPISVIRRHPDNTVTREYPLCDNIRSSVLQNLRELYG